jgi:hypothetical protein
MSKENKLIHGIVYINSTKCSNKCYVGKTTRKLNERIKKNFKGYSRKNKNGTHNHFYNAVLKYGPENFTTNILFEGDVTKNALNILEEWFIFIKDTFRNGYNETT